MKDKPWKFTDSFGNFTFPSADKIKSLYFPLCNGVITSSISPDLHGDIKTNQNSFLLTPVSRIDLVDSRSSRNFWVRVNNGKIWSACGVSKDFKQIQDDKFNLEAGLLWQKITRENRNIGLKAEILSFVPASGEPVEIMQLKITNISSQKINLTPTSAIPIYARSANNLRDHRHVTSLLQRISLHKYGLLVKPALSFDESGHKPNKNTYFVLGWSDKVSGPQYLYPTQEMFCGESGDLEAPQSVIKNMLPDKNAHIQGKEAMGGLRFKNITLKPGKSCSYIILMGITENKAQINTIIKKFNSLKKVDDSLTETNNYWAGISQRISLSTGDYRFDNWFQWVNIQPTLRKFFGCSFLPDFDYGKGGRGWRDLWQDCLGFILNDPGKVRNLLINNFSGVRIDGSNATIIGDKPGEFISDRNNISRVWMDHGVWPLLTLDLYLNETGDFNILSEETTYFRNLETCRAQVIDQKWDKSYGQKLKTRSGKIYKGSIFEHILVQNLVQFFNVGAHNFVRLEGADWNDGLDMAGENGESVTFSAMYASNLKLLSELLLKSKIKKIKIAKELNLLLIKIDYYNIKAKLGILENYFTKAKSVVSGDKISIDAVYLVNDLRLKSEWMMEHIRKLEWLTCGFFNGYYDNKKTRVEGTKNGIIRMMLQSQVFPIMSGTANERQIAGILKAVNKYLLDKKLKGFHLNTDFKDEQRDFGRAFSFVYGDKENGALFNHMSVMFAYALYNRRFVKEAWKVLNSVYNMAINSQTSKIYPCLPEYFNLEGKGMYSYLTGSASWFVLTVLTQSFGVKGKDGDLLIEPKLCLEQFKQANTIGIERSFANRRLRINFSNPKKLEYGKYKIIKVSLNSRILPVTDVQRIIIDRKTIFNLPSNRINTINIILGC